jgi:hypothetical protein
VAPPALLVAMAVGLGSVDMPLPAVAEWEWLNWKFPRAVHPGDTIYARWTLTQKRPPVGGEPTAIVVWRVDVHTASGALCAEGEVGASVLRNQAPAKARVAEPTIHTAAATPPPAGTPAASATTRRRRRRRAPTGDGAKNAEAKTVVAEAPVVAAPAATPPAERTASGSRRRRRRRSPSSAQPRNGDTPAPAAPVEAAIAPALSPAASGAEAPNTLTRVIRRLRRT